MKNKEVAVMENGDDYDQMLRGMFESCDTVGLGLLTPNDFDRLCKKLSMQEHATLLSQVLFSETNKRKLLSYETFRDTLILFLTGDAGFPDSSAGCEKNDIYPEEASLPHPGSDDDWNNNLNNNNSYSDENAITGQLESLYTESGRFTEEILTSDPDFTSDTALNVEVCHNNRTLSSNMESFENRRRPRPAGSPIKYRRYGRKSKPDQDLLRTRKNNGDLERAVVLREVHMDNSANVKILDERSPENSPWKGVEVSFISEEPTSPACKKEEEFSGEGNDDTWKRPDSEWISENNLNIHRMAPEPEPIPEETVHPAQSVLGTVWCRVVGDPGTEPMNEHHMGILCSELGMGAHLSSDDEISQLFAALDQDNDGLVTFDEFSQQMSAFINCSTTDEQKQSGDCDVTPKYDLENSDLFPDKEASFSNECVFSTSDVLEDDELTHGEMGTSFEDDASGRISPILNSGTPGYMYNPRSPESQPGPTASVVTPSRDDVVSNLNTSTKSHTCSEGSTPDSRGGLSLDDTSPLCPPIVSVEPRQLAAINRGRRRRRSSAVAASNPAGIRPGRRKSSRSIPLPHYHPASLRRLDELPLSYLTEENERYVSLDSLQQCWEREGLEKSSDVFEALQVPKSEQTVSIEALSEVLDMELDQNIVQKAALILYKNGINHYRSQYEHERSERNKLESNMEHLLSQLQEQEERIEKEESKFENKTEDIEAKYKIEIRDLTNELSAAQETIKELEQVAKTKKENDYNELVDNYEKCKALADELKAENTRLLREKEETETRLLEAEEESVKAREDLDVTCHRLAVFSREHAHQKKELTNVLRMYDTHAQSVQDHNDELLDRLQQSRKRWTPNRSRSPNSRIRNSTGSYKSSPSLRGNDTSSYSSASSLSEESSPHHLSSVKLFASHDPSPSSSRFMTSSPSDTPDKVFCETEPMNIIKSNTFAFLTPSTTHAKSRVNPTSKAVFDLIQETPTYKRFDC